MREEEEFKWRLGEEEEGFSSPPRRSRRGAGRKRPRADLFGKLWFWYADILLEKRASGRMLRFLIVLMIKDFDEWHKPFKVTTEMMARAGIDRKDKSTLLRIFEQWGFVFVDRRNKKNPLVSLRERQGRGENPFHNCG
jgi:hypothetical protein